MPNVVNQLKQVSLFANLKKGDLKAVAQLVRRSQYPAGSEVCHQGRLGDTAYVVESGELRVIHINPQGMRQEVALLGTGAFFGETSLLLGEPRDATVEVVQDAVLLALAKDDLDQLMHERLSVLEALDMSPAVEGKRLAHHFTWQDPDEIIIVHLHKHKWVLVRHIIFPIFVLLVDLVGCGYYWAHNPGKLWVLIAGAILALIPIAFIIYLYLDHENDHYVVTNKRVVHEEHVLIFREARVEAPLRAVQDIQESQVGLLAQIGDYGDLIIETAGEHGHVVFREIPDPEGTREAIIEQIDRVQSGTRAMEISSLRAVVRRHFGISSDEEQTTAPAEDPPKKQRFKLEIPTWLLAFRQVFTYFLPPLRHEQGDTITWRKHWVALLKPIALPTLLIVAATVVAIIIAWRSPGNWMPTLIGYSTLLVFLFPWWLWKFDDWQNDIYQVTTTRIIDVERLPFYLREDRREASLGVIQNISLEIPDFVAKLLNYGSVTIETAGIGAFTFSLVKDPRSVQAEIFRRVDAFQERQRQAELERHQAEMLDWFSAYEQVRQSQPFTPQPEPSRPQKS
ncbi:MAG: cyclic nucleotide-binding domain-containing protein [Chloroflexota bacterium]|nr:cyclic nucleotide-binding domain-containing protein [Chloroflexota bacterium]